MTPKYKTALFAGSFNPFTLGHLRIVERALGIMDRVVVAIGINIHKPHDEAMIEERIRKIEEAVERFNIQGEEPRVTVTAYAGLTAEFARRSGADILLRGIRSVADFEYERNLADINLKLLGIDTMFLCAEPDFGHISSSTVRELEANGYDVSPLLP